MSDITIGDIPREKTVIDSSDWFEGQDGSGSFKSHIAGIRGLGVVPVTTSATSQDIDAVPKVVQVTSSGSGGTDLINLVSPTLNANNINTDFLGSRVYVVLATRTNPADIVQVTVDGAPYLNWMVRDLTTGQSGNNTILLDYVGACVCFVWVADSWVIDANATDQRYGGEVKQDIVSIGPGPVASGQGMSLFLDPGHGPDGNGQVYLGLYNSLPTADPHERTALWIDPANGYVLKVSQG